MNKLLRKAAAWVLSAAMALSMVAVPAFAANTAPSTAPECEVTSGISSQLVTMKFTQNEQDWFNAIKSVTVDGTAYEKSDSSPTFNYGQNYWYAGTVTGAYGREYVLQLTENFASSPAAVVVKAADAEIAAAGAQLHYEVGTMIEIPRACLTADEIAKEAEFFCFGTNDLTQLTYGFSRDDAGKFLDAYYDAKIFENDPFAKLDQTGVGALMQMAVEKGKKVRPELHCGICGEHGGDPMSVEFCHRIGLDYVSCSPFRVPIARLAAAQAAIKDGRN